ncbi:MAG: hypothetical protein V3T86_01800 [Planctomycetota bacterium]
MARLASCLFVFVVVRGAVADEVEAHDYVIEDLRPAVKQFEEKIPKLRKAIEAHRAAGRVQDADAFAKRLEWLSTRWQNKFVPPNDMGTELHYVGCYTGKDAKIKVIVTHTAAPIVLALSAYDSVLWTVQAAPGVKLKRIVVGGYHEQKVVGVDQVPIEYHTYDGKRSPDRFYVYTLRDERFVDAGMKLVKLTDLPIRTFIGAYRPRNGVLTVGPTDMIWRSEYLRLWLDRLEHDVLRRDRENWLQKLGNLEFHAVHREQDPRREFWARFGVRGPNPASLLAIPTSAHVTFDAQHNRFYALRGHALVTFAKHEKKATELKPPIGTPGLSWPCGIAFDTKRKRVLIITRGGEGKLRSYDPNNGAWKTIASLENRDYSSLTYDGQEDAMYATHHGRHRGVSFFSKLSVEGKILNDVPIQKPIAIYNNEPVQIASRGEYLLMLAGSDRVYAIHKTTGAIVLGVRPKPIDPQ